MSRLLYLHGVAGDVGLSPALEAVVAAGHEVVAPTLPGFDGPAGWEAPGEWLDWITATFDVIDASGALPGAVVGAGVGGMFAAELAALRPEVVENLVLLAPFGIHDDGVASGDVFGVPANERVPQLFGGSVPDEFSARLDARFADRGPAEQAVAQYLAWVAGAGTLWPLPDHGIANRLHRITCPTAVVWGEGDKVNPVALASRWPADAVTIEGAGHYVEWDAPDRVAAIILGLLG